MGDVDPNRTVFISYRRKVSRYIARAIFENLRNSGYDVFLDVENLDSGDWRMIILNQIAARAHFLLILTGETLDRCVEPNDMLRQEIEHAIDLKRNIVPVLIDEFEFAHAQVHLSGKLEALPEYNALKFYYDYFDAGMDKLRNRFLLPPAALPTVQPTPQAEEARVEQIVETALSEPVPTQEELTAEQYFVRGYQKGINGDHEGAITDFSEAIRLHSGFVEAFSNRGEARRRQGDFESAVSDFNEAIRLNSEYVDAYNNRGLIRADTGDPDGAFADYNKAIHLDPTYPYAYLNRGTLRAKEGDYDSAIADFDEAIRIHPNYAMAYSNRGAAWARKHHYERAIADLDEAIRLDPDYKDAYRNRGAVHMVLGRLDAATEDFDAVIRLNQK